MAASNVTNISYTAYMTVGGKQYDIQSLEIVYPASGRAYAAVALMIGRAAGSHKAQTIDVPEDELATITIRSSGNQGPNGVVFTGYTQTHGPQQILNNIKTANPSITLIHKDTLDLDTGATATWPYTPTGGFSFSIPTRVDSSDPNRSSTYLSTSVASALTASNVKSRGLLSLIKEYFIGTAQGAKGEITSKRALLDCAGSFRKNEIAIAAIDRLSGNQLNIHSSLLSGERFIRFISSRMTNDLRLMSYFEQMQTLAKDLFFELVPKADGSLLIQPISAKADAVYKTLTGDEIFDFSPQGVPRRRVCGVMLIGNGGFFGVQSRTPIGCYILESVAKRGVIQSVETPIWYNIDGSIGTVQTRRTLDASSSVNEPNPVTNAVPEDSQINLGDVGIKIAREYAMRLRYGDSSASFSTYLRTDIAPMSDIKIVVPTYNGTTMGLVGRVQSLRLQLDTDSKTSSTSISLTYVRSEADDAALGSNGHPIFTQNWAGGTL